MNPYIWVTSGKIKLSDKLSSIWKFSFTTGYGAWALSTASQGQNKQVQTIPWEAVLHIKINEFTPSFLHKQIGPQPLYNGEYYEVSVDKNGGLGFLVWTKSQWLYIKEVMRNISWYDPYTFLCSMHAIRDSGFYTKNQIEFLDLYLEPEWSGKGLVIDDKTFFNNYYNSKFLVYPKFWELFMTKLRDYLVKEGFLFIINPKITDDTILSIYNESSNGESSDMKKKFSEFFLNELQIGIFKKTPKETVARFHVHLPDCIQKWIESGE